MKQNIKSSLIWAIILLAAMVMGFLISIAISRRADATLHTDYAENIYNRPLINWKVEYWLDTGDEVGDTVFVAVDTTTAGGEYTLELESNRYLISAFPLWGDATDSTGSRRQWVKEEAVVVAVLDTFSFPFVKADSGFIGTVQGNIATADYADSAGRVVQAWESYNADTADVLVGNVESADYADSTGVAVTAWGPADDDFVVPDTVFAADFIASGEVQADGDISTNSNLDVDGQIDVAGIGIFQDDVTMSGLLSMDSGADIIAGTTGSQITNFDYATIKHIEAADSVKTNYQTGKMYSYKFVSSGEVDAGFYGILFGNADSADVADSSDVAHRAHTAIKFDVSDTAMFGGHAQHNSTLTVGVDGTGYDVNCYGDSSGSRLLWNTSKHAFRAGWVTGDQWHPDSIGPQSFAVGKNTMAIGINSAVFGKGSIASGTNSMAGGRDSYATGDQSIAFGCDATASGYAATALGFSDAQGAHSVALGRATAVDNRAVAMGDYASATGVNAVAVGYYAETDGKDAIAIGSKSRAYAGSSFVFGQFLQADTTHSMIIGWGNSWAQRLYNRTPNSIVFGVRDTTATMTIVDDMVTVDGALVVNGEFSVSDTVEGIKDTSASSPIAYHLYTGGLDTLDEQYLHLKGPMFLDKVIMGSQVWHCPGSPPMAIGGSGFTIGDDADISFDTTGVKLGLANSIKFGTGPAITATATQVEFSEKLTGPGFTLGDSETPLNVVVSGTDEDAVLYGVKVTTAMDTCYLSYPFSVYAANNRSKHLWGYSFTADGAITDTVYGFYADMAPGPNAVVDWGFYTEGDAYFGDTTKTARLVATTSIYCGGNITANTIVGNLEGTADHATTASTCTTWTGSGTVDDSLAALRTDVVNLDATVSTHGDSLSALTTDIAALQATKVDTNTHVHRDSWCWYRDYLSSSLTRGSTGHPLTQWPDTVAVREVSYWVKQSGVGQWDYVILNAAGDTIVALLDHTVNGEFDTLFTTPANATFLPGDGPRVAITEDSGTIGVYWSVRVGVEYVNP